MKKFIFLFLALVAFSLSGCGTIGGALSGAGSDLTSAGNWVKEIGQRVDSKVHLGMHLTQPTTIRRVSEMIL